MSRKQIVNKKSGFTLVELLIVIAIVGILSSVVLTVLVSARENARITKAQSDLRALHVAFLSYITENGGDAPSGWSVPDCTTNHNGDDLPNGARLTESYMSSIGLGEYLSSHPVDPWGNDYIVDSRYNCSSGNPLGCEDQENGTWIWTLHSAGPNGSNVNAYDGDNIMHIVCDHAN